MNDTVQPTLIELILKSIVAHTVTYFFMGVLAYSFLNYSAAYSYGPLACLMRPTSDPLVMAGVLFQPIRGMVFALAFYPLREPLFRRVNGWLILWWLLISLGILSTFGPAPASIEAMIYTKLPLPTLKDYIEIVPQALLFSGILFIWIRHPGKKWLTLVLGIMFAIVLLLPIMGLLVTKIATH